MDRTDKADRKRHKEELELLHIDMANQLDDSVYFTIDEAEWGDVPTSPLPSPQIRKYDRHRYFPSVSEDGSLGSYSNPGFQDYQQLERNTHSPFDSDRVFLFNRPGQRRFNIRKKLAAAWCATCVSRIWQYLISSCALECSCRDQTGVHYMYRLKQKAMKKLKVLQGVLCLVTIILSGMVFFPLGNNTKDFDGNCLLNANLFINKISGNNTVALDKAHSQFGSANDCNFTTFINVCVTVAGLFFIWFFIHTSYVSGLEQSETKLQLPVFLCYLILLVSVIVSSFKITIGFNSWCANIISNNQFRFVGRRLECRDYEILNWSTDNKSHFYSNSVLAEISTWLLVLTLIIQLSVTALHLYQNIKAAYDEIEVPHLRLEEYHEFSDEEQSDYEPRGALSTLDCSVAPSPVYVVEYKKHQVLAKVVVHSDKAVNQFDLKNTLVLDTDKFKRNIGFHRFDDFRSRRKVDFPLKMEPGRRKRQNWTGSCEELFSGREFEEQIRKQRNSCFHEWHGFDTDINKPDENSWVGQSPDWHIVFESEDHKTSVSKRFEWPATDDISISRVINSSSEWHGFETDFVGHQKKTSSSLPKHWQTFDMNCENQTTDKFEWADQDVETDVQIKDPWTFEQLGHQASENSNYPNTFKDENNDNLREDLEEISEVNISNKCVDKSDSEKR